MWQNFNKNIPNWPTQDKNWPSVSVVATKMGDLGRAVTHTGSLISKRLEDTAWHTNDCALTILNCCIDFDVDGPVYIVPGSVIKSDSQFIFKLDSMSSGMARVRLRLPDPGKNIVELNGKPVDLKAFGCFSYMEFKVKKERVNEITVCFK